MSVERVMVMPVAVAGLRVSRPDVSLASALMSRRCGWDAAVCRGSMSRRHVATAALGQSWRLIPLDMFGLLLVSVALLFRCRHIALSFFFSFFCRWRDGLLALMVASSS